MALEGTCSECQKKFTMTSRKMFCSTEHQVAYNNRQLTRGQAMATLAQAWWGHGSSKDKAFKMTAKEAYSQLATLARKYNAEDKDAGRMSATEVLVRRRAKGLLQ
jgi:hypothetical protein